MALGGRTPRIMQEKSSSPRCVGFNAFSVEDPGTRLLESFAPEVWQETRLDGKGEHCRDDGSDGTGDEAGESNDVGDEGRGDGALTGQRSLEY